MTNRLEYLQKVNLNPDIFQKLNVEPIDAVILSSKCEFNVELVYTHFITQNIKNLYWHYSSEIYNRYYFGIQAENVSPIVKSGESVKCELCGTNKSIENQFEITKCRKLDQSIIENMIKKFNEKVSNVFNTINDSTHEGKQLLLDNMLVEFSLFTEKFSRFGKFSRYIWNDFKYLILKIGKIDILKHFSLKQIRLLNNILKEFRNKLEQSFLSIS